MAFHLIDMDTWERREHYHYYKDFLKVRYNLNVQIDITELLTQVKEQKLKFYPVFIYIIMKAVNQNREMRMQIDAGGRLGYWDECHPSYTIFHEDDKTFSDIWTEYNEDFYTFYDAVRRDMETYRDQKGIKPKPGKPDNFCPVSCVPWLSFDGYAAIRTPIRRCSIQWYSLDAIMRKMGEFFCLWEPRFIMRLQTDITPAVFLMRFRSWLGRFVCLAVKPRR